MDLMGKVKIIGRRGIPELTSFPLFQADWLGLNHFITEPEKTQWLIFTLLVHRPNFEVHCCFYYAS